MATRTRKLNSLPVILAVLALGLLGVGKALAQVSKPDGSVPVEDLMKPSAIEDISLGNANAPVTIVEYASLTCPHCATFHLQSLPVLKRDFVESGKVRFIYRDFPFDGLALAATMIARCAPRDRFFGIIDTLFAEQQGWAFSNAPEAAVTAIALRHGFTQESFNACLQNQKIYDGVLAIRQRAHETFDVNSTPTIFINGARYRGVLNPADLAEAVKAALPAGMK